MVVCELCKSQDFKVIATEIREGPGIILQCRQCGLVLQDIQQTEKDLENYYNVEYQRTNSLRFGKIQTPHEHFQDSYSSSEKIFKKILPFLDSNKRLLEIGCGSGGLLFWIKPHVKETIGVELNKEFVHYINNELGILAFSQDINSIDFLNGSFDIIICIMTLDHLPNPTQTLATMKRLLKSDGIIYIEVPNLNEALNQYLPEPSLSKYKTFFWHKAHYFYFTKDTLTMLLKNIGLTSEISCSHQYTLINFLNWYFCGSPQKTFIEATLLPNLFKGDNDFEKQMNILFFNVNHNFHKILEETFTGDTLCCIASHQKVFK